MREFLRIFMIYFLIQLLEAGNITNFTRPCVYNASSTAAIPTTTFSIKSKSPAASKMSPDECSSKQYYSTSERTCKDCLKDWHGCGSKCYKSIRGNGDLVSKKDSKTECHNLGAKLVSFDGTKEKFQCLHSLWADFTSRDYWLNAELTDSFPILIDNSIGFKFETTNWCPSRHIDTNEVRKGNSLVMSYNCVYIAPISWKLDTVCEWSS